MALLLWVPDFAGVAAVQPACTSTCGLMFEIQQEEVVKAAFNCAQVPAATQLDTALPDVAQLVYIAIMQGLGMQNGRCTTLRQGADCDEHELRCQTMQLEVSSSTAALLLQLLWRSCCCCRCLCQSTATGMQT